jgi:hypothetical protein
LRGQEVSVTVKLRKDRSVEGMFQERRNEDTRGCRFSWKARRRMQLMHDQAELVMLQLENSIYLAISHYFSNSMKINHAEFSFLERCV